MNCGSCEGGEGLNKMKMFVKYIFLIITLLLQIIL